MPIESSSSIVVVSLALSSSSSSSKFSVTTMSGLTTAGRVIVVNFVLLFVEPVFESFDRYVGRNAGLANVIESFLCYSGGPGDRRRCVIFKCIPVYVLRKVHSGWLGMYTSS